MPIAPNDRYDQLVELRGQLLSAVADLAEAVALSPGLTQVQGARMLAGIQVFPVAVIASVKTAHSSSSSSYALQDLPNAQGLDLARAQHAIALLERMYAERPMDPSRG